MSRSSRAAPLDFATGSATADDLLGADGYLLGTTANFGYMSGALKHVFDSTFLAIGGSLAPDGSAAPVGGSTTGRPFGLYLLGRYDTTGAVRSVMAITGALGWRQAFGVLEVMGMWERTPWRGPMSWEGPWLRLWGT
jgi:multimeric flavodoxin WrbA